MQSLVERRVALTQCLSHQAADAGARLNVPVTNPLRAHRIPRRRSNSILRILPNDTMYDSPFHSNTVYGVRVTFEGDEPAERVRPDYPLRSWWLGRSIRGGHHNST